LQVSDTSNLGTNYPLLLQPNGGNVGIGTSSPSTFLHVLGSNTSARGQLSIQSNNTSNAAKATWYYDTFNSGEIGTTGSDFYGLATNNFLLYAGGSERMRISSSGKVGIGTSSPSYLLHLGNTYTDAGSLSSGGNLYGSAYFGQDGLVVGIQSTTSNVVLMTYASNKAIIFGTWNGSTNVERMRIKTNTINITSIPTSSAGLSSGDIYSSAGVLMIV
jgi:hypothetical protein